MEVYRGDNLISNLRSLWVEGKWMVEVPERVR